MILRNPHVLDPDFVPEALPFREAHIQELVRSVRYALEGRVSSSLLLIGPPGTGKTAVVRYVLRELTSTYPNVFAFYVNTWVYRTRYAVLSQLARALSIPTPRRGVAMDEVFERILERMEQYSTVVLALDEIDRMAREGEDVLYDLSRLGAFLETPSVLFTIANREDFLFSLDPRVHSTLFRSRLTFQPYTVPQLKKILSERARLALSPGTYDDEVLGFCAAVGWKRGGDARAAISCLFEAAKIAEVEGARRITLEHARRAADRVSPVPLPHDPRYALIVQILRERGEMRVKELYEEYVRRGGQVTLRAFRNYLKDMERAGIIRVERLNVRGFVRVVRLAG